MQRNFHRAFIAVLMLSIFVAHPVQAAKSYFAERFDVQIDIQENGSILVTETVEFQFIGDPFTYVVREIAATNTDGITFLNASMDGAPLSPGTRPGQVEVQEGDPLRVTWHFAPTSNKSHIFVVHYRADGVIRKGDADTLIWRAVPENHDYRIAHSTITLAYPSRARLTEQPTLELNFDATWEDGRVVLTAGGLAENEDLILTARFAPGSLTERSPLWQFRAEQAAAAVARALPVGTIVGIVTLLMGGLGLMTLIRANGRDMNPGLVMTTAYPPSDVSPAIVGKLTGQQHGFMGSIFDLAQRGVLEILEQSGFWGTKKYLLVRSSLAALPVAHEQGLLEALFGPNKTQLNMNEIATRLTTSSELYNEPLENELIQRGWLDLERKHRRARLSAGGALMLILSIGVLILSLVGASASLSENSDRLPWLAAAAGISVGLLVLSIVLLVYGRTYSVLTASGEEEAVRWRGFAEYLKHVSLGDEPTIRPDVFEKYLAYAAVFGLGAGWAKHFQDLGGIPLPVWFHALAGSEADFGGIVAVMSASDSTGASAGGDGGAGASGGGSSGAG